MLTETIDGRPSRMGMVPGPLVADWLQPLPQNLKTRRREELAPGVWVVSVVIWYSASALDNLAAAPVPEVEPQRRVLPFGQWAWHADAACKGMDDVVFFGVDQREGPTFDPKELTEARNICASCPVQRECLTHALTQPELAGVWAGTSGQQRSKWLRMIRDGLTTVEELAGAWLTK